jgi:hypothetical protein
VKNFSASDREMTKYIIGAIASGDKPKSPKAKAQKSDSDFFNNITEELRAKTRREMLSATPSSIASLAEPLKNMLDENIICVFSSKEKIEQNGDKFKSVITIK